MDLFSQYGSDGIPGGFRDNLEIIPGCSTNKNMHLLRQEGFRILNLQKGLQKKSET